MKAKWITPVVTALDRQGHVDVEANLRIYDFLIENGMDGILIFGSIGEFFAIPMEEKRELLKKAIAHIKGRVTVYAGTCHMELDQCVEFSNYALELGADGVMVISPYYFSLPDSGILNFYDRLAEGIQGDLLLYNFPDRTGHDLSADLIYDLVSRHENIVGIKDTVSTMGHTRGIIQKVKKDYPNFQVFSGISSSCFASSRRRAPSTFHTTGVLSAANKRRSPGCPPIAATRRVSCSSVINLAKEDL